MVLNFKHRHSSLFQKNFGIHSRKFRSIGHIKFKTINITYSIAEIGATLMVLDKTAVNDCWQNIWLQVAQKENKVP